MIESMASQSIIREKKAVSYSSCYSALSAAAFSLCVLVCQSRALAVEPGVYYKVTPAPVASLGDQAKPERAPASQEDLLAALDEALDSGQTERARDALLELLHHPVVKADVLLEAGVKFAQQGLYQEALSAFLRCVKEYPKLFEGYYNLALCNLALGNLGQALAFIEEAPHSHKQQEIARLYMRGKIEAGMGQWRDAERDLSEAFAASPGEENYALDLGLLYLHRTSYAKAIDIFERASRSPDASPLVWLGLSLAQFLGGMPAESVETSTEILSRDESFSPARLLKVFILYKEGKYQEASDIAGAGLGLGVPDPYLYYLHAMAQIRLHSKGYEEMLHDLALAAKGIPACSLCYVAESEVHQAMGHPEKARGDLEEALRLDPTLAEAWYRLASLDDQTGRHADAIMARAQFMRLKENKANRETEMIQNAFIKAFNGQPQPAKDGRTYAAHPTH